MLSSPSQKPTKKPSKNIKTIRSPINLPSNLNKQGEIFLCNEDTNGALEPLNHFKGTLIAALGGGYNKLFIIQDTPENVGIVSSLHPPESNTTGNNDDNVELPHITDPLEYLSAFDDKGTLSQIRSGKKHTIILSDKGKVYSYGIDEFGSLGLGGLLYARIPKAMNKLLQHKIVQISTGEYHSLALSDYGDVFSWGRGFEGQLGLSHSIQTISTPHYIKSFANIPIKFITCGAYYSLAIDLQGNLYGWGEAKLGQLGLGRMLMIQLPTKIEIFEQKPIEYTFNEAILHTKISIKSNPISPNVINSNQLITFQMVAAGYGHTLGLTKEGHIYSWGLNCKGQLGNGDKKTRYSPVRLFVDQLGNPLPEFKTISCGYFTSFAIDLNGKVFSWGGGELGHKDDKLQELPRRIESPHIENHIFSDIFCTEKSHLFFSPMRIISILPNSGPSCGGTMLSLLGTGFVNTGKQAVKFLFGDFDLEVPASYNLMSGSLSCITPKFHEIEDAQNIWPLDVEVQVTLDGINYVSVEEKFFVYSSTIGIVSIMPRCASVQGGTSLTLTLNIDEITSNRLENFIVGFQAKPINPPSETTGSTNIPPMRELKSSTSMPIRPLDALKHKDSINPLVLNTYSPELDKETWICVRGNYEKRKITCAVPKVNELTKQTFHFNVDISLNGQQFTGLSSSFRFYDISIQSMIPKNGMSMGGTYVKIIGKGFFDTIDKKIKVVSKYGERLVDVNWEKNEKNFSFIAPPITWLFGGNIPTPEMIAELKNDTIQIYLTVNNYEWYFIDNFSYFDPDYDRIVPVSSFETGLTEEAKKKKWLSEEEEQNPFVNCKNEVEIEKKKAELGKIIAQEDEEIANVFRKPGSYLYLRGQNFIKSNDLSVQFIYENKGITTKAIWKNKTRIGVIVPELDDLPSGIRDIKLEISYNGQQFSNLRKGIKYLAFDKTLTPEQRQKLEDEELKKIKKVSVKK